MRPRHAIAVCAGLFLSACVGTENKLLKTSALLPPTSSATTALGTLNSACIEQAGNEFADSASLLKQAGFNQPISEEEMFKKPGEGYAKLQKKRGTTACFFYIPTSSHDALAAKLRVHLQAAYESVRYLPKRRTRADNGQPVIFHNWAVQNPGHKRHYASVTPPLYEGTFAGHSAVIFGSN